MGLGRLINLVQWNIIVVFMAMKHGWRGNPCSHGGFTQVGKSTTKVRVGFSSKPCLIAGGWIIEEEF